MVGGAQALGGVFAADGGGGEPLDKPELAPKFRALLGAGTKPFECVGERRESAVALRLLADRPPWRNSAVVAALAPVARSLVDDEDVDAVGQARQRSRKVAFLVSGEDDGGDVLAIQWSSGAAIRSAPASPRMRPSCSSAAPIKSR